MDEVKALIIRGERSEDRVQVGRVNEVAFGRLDEADLIEKLRIEGAILLSLIAESGGQIVGHLLFSRMTVETVDEADGAVASVAAVALAPMAVLPEMQRQQIGSKLIRRGLAELRERGEHIVIVLGHREFYPRFGFSSELAGQLSSPFPAGALMALELSEGALKGIRGEVRYAAAFGL